MFKKPLPIRFREKNPNVFAIRLSRAGVAIVPSANLALFVELRSTPDSRVLYNAPLLQPLPSDSLLTVTLPAGLEKGSYVVDVRFEPTGGPTYRVGVCQVIIVPVGSLDTVAEAQSLVVTINEQAQIIEANLDASPVAALAASYLQQMQELVEETETGETDWPDFSLMYSISKL